MRQSLDRKHILSKARKMPAAPSTVAILAAFVGLFLGAAALGGALAAAFAPGSWIAAVAGFFALPLAFAGGLQAWYGLALLSLIPRLLGRLWGLPPSAATRGLAPGAGIPGSFVFLPLELRCRSRGRARRGARIVYPSDVAGGPGVLAGRDRPRGAGMAPGPRGLSDAAREHLAGLNVLADGARPDLHSRESESLVHPTSPSAPVAKYTCQVPEVSGSRPTGCAARLCETFTRRLFQRIPPLVETRRTSSAPGR
jgi:hypothetical protein